MRSSIACLRCRKSKIKCDNDGGNTACESCIKAGLQCQYPESISHKRSESGAISKPERESGPSTKRVKRVFDEPVERSPGRVASEILSSAFLTSQLWDQLFALYKLHFASELFFLHIPTLKERISEKERTADLDLVLLGVLTLTCRFHNDLSTYIIHAPAFRHAMPKTRAKSDPLYVPEFFATQLLGALGPMRMTISLASIERVQAFLMLGYYEWTASSSNDGLAAWMFVGTAIRLAQGLNLGSEIDQSIVIEERTDINPDPLTGRRTSTSDLAVKREVRRRTMFSCFLIDRMLACASGRDTMIDPDKLEIQLPCTDMALDLARDVYTGTLRQKPHSQYRSITDDSVLSHLIQLANLWAGIARYSIEGGRHSEKEPLWYEGTIFKSLSDQLDHFCQSLPETFHLSRQNYFRHDNHQATSSYVALHMLISLCRIVLHRENVPFIPIRSGRSGEPSPLAHMANTPLMQHPLPAALWSDSVEKAFIGARDVLDLVNLCMDKLPLSPLICFAVVSAAFFSVYGHHFPHVDERQLLVDSRDTRKGKAFECNPYTKLAVQTLEKMAPLFPPLSNAIPILTNLDSYYLSVWTVIRDLERTGLERRRLSSGFGVGYSTDREGAGHDMLNAERERASISSTTDPARSNLSESSHRPIGSVSDVSAMQYMPESVTSSTEHPHHRPLPLGSFTAINEALRPVSAASETSFHNYPTRHPDRSQDSGWRVPPWGTAFSVEQLHQLESLRIGVVLHDLQAFAGAGVLGRPEQRIEQT